MRLTLLLILFSFSVSAQQVKLLTWNVFLRPAFLHDQQMQRVDSIAAHLKRSEADVLCLQEVFHKKARERLVEQLDSIYPYQLHPTKNGILKTNSGLLLLSRHPFKLTGTAFFDKLIAADKLSSKGVQFAIVNVDGKQLFICNTHLQAGTDDKYQEVRETQYPVLKGITSQTELVTFILGDLNTNIGDTVRCDQMLNVIGFDNLEPNNTAQGTANLPEQDLFPAEKGEAQLLDYILVNDSTKVKFIRSEIECFQSEWKKGRKYLSDHNAVEAIIEL